MVEDVVVWHRRDLRVADNAALEAARESGRPCPVFVVDPRFYDDRGLACDARLEFLFESLADLREAYRALGTDLAVLHGETTDRLRALLDDHDGRLVFNGTVTTEWGRRRDETVAGWPETTRCDDDGIVRTGRSREGWADQCEAYFEAEACPEPDSLPANPVDSDVDLDWVRRRYDVASEKRRVPRGGREAGVARLDRFVDVVGSYPGSVSPPADAERGCSRLSPYLKFGCLSPREVYQRVRDGAGGRGVEWFTSRLYWNRHYAQKLQDWPGWTERSVNPVFRNLHRGDHDPELVAAWKRGETGFPLVDAAMRALVETGWINFRLRSLVATFFSYVLGEWWKRGADFLYRHLIDADPGINYTQWQSQANLTGVHPVRVYDPAKQVREYDADGAYVRRYVPELEALPDAHLPRPEKTPLSVQENVGVRIGEDYPYPVVDFEARAAAARETYAALDGRAKEALRSDPELRRRASLSRRRDSLDDDEAKPTGQRRLGDF